MALTENVWDDSFIMESSDETYADKVPSGNFYHHNSTIECPTLWPTMTYNQCKSESDKEIWIAMFDEETTMDLFPTPPVSGPQMITNFQTLLKSAISSVDEPLQEVKQKLSYDRSVLKLQSDLYHDSKPLAQTAIHNTSFRHFTWQAMQTYVSQPIQQSVKRRLVL